MLKPRRKWARLWTNQKTPNISSQFYYRCNSIKAVRLSKKSTSLLYFQLKNLLNNVIIYLSDYFCKSNAPLNAQVITSMRRMIAPKIPSAKSTKKTTVHISYQYNTFSSSANYMLIRTCESRSRGKCELLYQRM